MVNGNEMGVCLNQCDPTTFEIDTTSTPPEVTLSTGGQISMDCCESNGYYYDSSNNKCTVCPSFSNNNYSLGNITFGGINYNTINDSNDQPLSKECCIYVNQESPLNYTWNVNIGCYEL